MNRKMLLAWILVTFISLPQLAGALGNQNQVELEPMLEVDGELFRRHFSLPSSVVSFDLSVNGKILAVEFVVKEKSGKQCVWVTLWDVETKRLIASKKVDGPHPDILVGNHSPDIQFSGDGSMVLVVTGRRLIALTVPELQVRYTIDPPYYENRQKHPDVFSTATSEGKFMILYNPYLSNVKDPSELHLVDLESGRTHERWEFNRDREVFTLSPNGKLLAAYRNYFDPCHCLSEKLLIHDLNTRKIVKRIKTAKTPQQILFLGNGSRLAVIPSGRWDVKTRKNRIQVWAISTGQLVKELSYKKFGLRGVISASRDGTRLVATTYWENPSDVRKDRSIIRGFVRFLLWDIPSGELLFTSSDLRGARASGRPPFLSRLSANGKRLVAGGEHIVVYEIKERPQIAASD